ncbi:MAG: hypothetical protein ACOYUZ_04090 [Patescibacteria group bacterium]
MVTLKQALDLAKLYESAYRKGIYNVDGSAFKREEQLRTKLAHAIVSSHPHLNPNNPEHLRLDGILPLSTILSPIAEAVYKKYRRFLHETFGISQNYAPKQTSAITCFADIRNTYKQLREQLGNTGSVRSWRPEELTAFRRLCVRLGNDNKMTTDYVMTNFDDLDNLVINEASIFLAERLFETLS